MERSVFPTLAFSSLDFIIIAVEKLHRSGLRI